MIFRNSWAFFWNTCLVLTGEMQVRSPATSFVILTMYGDPIYVSHAMDAGAFAYILKCFHSNELIQAIHEAASGHRYLSPSLSQQKPPRS